MNNPPSNDPYQKTFSFSSFVSDSGVGNDEVSILKKAVMLLLSKRSRQIASSAQMAHREATPIIEPSVVSRYKVDDFGRPRTLSKCEVILHTMAWPAVIAVVIGYGLTIFLVVIHNSSALKSQEKVSQPQVAFQQEEP